MPQDEAPNARHETMKALCANAGATLPGALAILRDKAAALACRAPPAAEDLSQVVSGGNSP